MSVMEEWETPGGFDERLRVRISLAVDGDRCRSPPSDAVGHGVEPSRRMESPAANPRCCARGGGARALATRRQDHKAATHVRRRIDGDERHGISRLTWRRPPHSQQPSAGAGIRPSDRVDHERMGFPRIRVPRKSAAARVMTKKA